MPGLSRSGHHLFPQRLYRVRCMSGTRVSRFRVPHFDLVFFLPPPAPLVHVSVISEPEPGQARVGEGGRRLLSRKACEKDTLNHHTHSPHFLLHPEAGYEKVWIVNTAVTFSIKVSLFSPLEPSRDGTTQCLESNNNSIFHCYSISCPEGY